MPVFSTLGALAEFKEVIAKPLPVSNINITRNNGYNLTVTFTPNIVLPPNYSVNYFGTLNNSNAYFSNSNTTTLTFSRIPPLLDYFATVSAQNLAGNSLPTNSSNYFMSSNLVANGNINISNASVITISPNDLELNVGTTTGYLLRYSRNIATGQLSLLSNTNICAACSSPSITSLEYSNDGNFLYIYGNSGSRIYNYNINSSSFATTGLSNVFLGNIAASKLYCNEDNTNLIAMGLVGSPATYRFINYSRNTSTGNLTLVQTVGVQGWITSISKNIPAYNYAGNLMVGVNDNSGNAFINYYTWSGNTIDFQNRGNIFVSSNANSIFQNIIMVQNTAHLNIGNAIKSYSYTTSVSGFNSIGNITTTTDGFLYCPIVPTVSSNTILYYNGNVTFAKKAGTTSNNLVLYSNSNSYSANYNSSVVNSYDTLHAYVLTGNTLSIYNILS